MRRIFLSTFMACIISLTMAIAQIITFSLEEDSMVVLGSSITDGGRLD